MGRPSTDWPIVVVGWSGGWVVVGVEVAVGVGLGVEVAVRVGVDVVVTVRVGMGVAVGHGVGVAVWVGVAPPCLRGGTEGGESRWPRGWVSPPPACGGGPRGGESVMVWPWRSRR
jgi:hypothetical protein